MEHAIIMIIAIIMITRLNIWSSPLSIDRLKSESGCDGEKSVMGTPDLLAWETSRWDIWGNHNDEDNNDNNNDKKVGRSKGKGSGGVPMLAVRHEPDRSGDAFRVGGS